MYCSNCGQNNPAESSFCANCGAAVAAVAEPPQQPLPTQTGVPAATALEYAGFGLRFGALIIDSMILWVISMALNVLALIAVLAGTGGFIVVAIIGLLLPWVTEVDPKIRTGG